MANERKFIICAAEASTMTDNFKSQKTTLHFPVYTHSVAYNKYELKSSREGNGVGKQGSREESCAEGCI